MLLMTSSEYMAEIHIKTDLRTSSGQCLANLMS